MIERRDRLDAVAIVLLAACCATWGLNQVAVKVANAGFPPLLQCGLRSIGAGLLLFAWTRLRGTPLFDRDGTLWPGLLAGLLFASEFALIYWALQYTPASRGVLFVYAAPFFVVLGLHWLEPAERIGRWQTIGMVCAFGGLIAAFADGIALPQGREVLGDLLLLLAAALWGATTVVIRASRLASVGAAKVLFYQLAVSAVLMPLASWAVGEPRIANPSRVEWASFVFQIVIVAFVSYLVWFWLISRYPATRLSAFSFLTPLFGVIFGAWLLGEPLTPLLGLALALVALGLWLVNRKRAT